MFELQRTPVNFLHSKGREHATSKLITSADSTSLASKPQVKHTPHVKVISCKLTWYPHKKPATDNDDKLVPDK